MITTRTGLPDHVLDEIFELERRVVTADGGRLKLEWNSLRTRSVDDVVVREDGRLVGFLGIYRHGAEPEVTGMIDPTFRRRGLGHAALTRALELVHDASTVLLVVPRLSTGGRALALRFGGVLEHSEYALTQRVACDPIGEPAGLTVRAAVERDRPTVDALVQDGFGFSRDPGDSLAGTLLADLDGRSVATLAVARDGERASVYGFVVDPGLRGRGIGRAVLARTCQDLRTEGVTEVQLEVEVANERALGLYTSLGFESVTTEDYYRLATST